MLDTEQALNPFDDERHAFWVLVNAHGDHSLWPEFADLPAGWDVRYGPAHRADCLAHIERSWTSLNPLVPSTPLVPRR